VPATARRLAVRPVLGPALLGLVVGLAAVAPLVHHHLTVDEVKRLVDLRVYYDAGWSLVHGRAVYEHVTIDNLPFTYPPFAALLCVPLVALPFDVLGVLWTASELALTAAITWWAFRPLLARTGRWWPLALAVLAAAMQLMLPLRDEIKFGQVDELVVALCLADCVVRRPRWPRGLLVGIATAVKLTPGVFIPYLWFTGRRRAAAVAAGSFAALTLLPAVVTPHEFGDFWFDKVFDTERLRANAGTSNQAIRGWLLRTDLPKPLLTVLWLAACLLVAWLGYRRAVAAHRGGDETAGVALVGLLAVLLSPVAWIHHLAWLPLVIGVIVDDGRDRRRIVAAVGVWLFFVLKIPWWGVTLLKGDAPEPLGRLVQNGFGFAAVGLLLLLPARMGPNRPLPSGSPVGHNEAPTEVGRASPER
jgi:alpha-1,2-mannosyltransferase